MSQPLPPAEERFRDPFATLAGFMTALQLARLIGLKVWGAGFYTSTNTIFFMGAASGQQLRVHLFHILFIPAAVASWVWACKRIAAAGPFYGLNAAVSWPVWAFLFRMPGWTLAACVVAFLFSSRRDHPLLKTAASALCALYSNLSVVLVGIFFYYLWNFPGWSPPFDVDLYHEGVQLGPAMDFLAGKAPFRDIFIPQGLIHNVLKTAAAFSLFGESIAAKKLMDALAWPLGCVGMAVLGRLTLKNALSWLGFLIVLPLTFNYFPDRHFLACLSLAALAAAEFAGEGWMILLAGGLAGWQVWESLEVGLYAIAAGLVFLLFKTKTRKAAFQAYLAGLIGLSLPFILYLIARGAFGEFLHQSYLRCAVHQASEGLRFHILKLGPSSRTNDPLWLWYLPLMLQYGAVSLLILRWKRWPSRERSVGLLLTLAAILFFFSALSRGDFENLSFSAPYSILLGFWLMEKACASIFCGAGLAQAALVLSLIMTTGASLGSMLAWGTKLRLKTDAMPSSLATLSGRKVSSYGRLEQAHLGPELESLLEKIKQLYPADAPMLPLMGESGLLFLSSRRNLSRYYLPDYISSESIELEVLAELKAAADPIVVTYRDMKRLADRQGRPFDHLRGYLESRCRPAWSSEHFTLWKRRP